VDDDFVKNIEKTTNITHLKAYQINSPFKCFMLSFNESVVNGIVNESVKYFEQHVSKGAIKISENRGSTDYMVWKRWDAQWFQLCWILKMRKSRFLVYKKLSIKYKKNDIFCIK